MRIRRRELRLGAAVLGVCAVALGLVFWMGGASQSSEIPVGGSSEFQKSAHLSEGGGQSQAPNQIFPTPSGATPDGSPAELWAGGVSDVEAQAEDEAPAELWADPFVTLDNGAAQSGPDELWTEVAARTGETPGKLMPPSDASFKDMVKARAEEFAGGVDAAGMPLYRFNLWLNAPTDRAASVVKVAYRFEALSATHTALASADRTQDFRVEFGAASCPKKVDVELTFLDGRTEAHEVDGCAILQ